MSCDRCNEERENHIKYCRHCGTDLTVPNGGVACKECARSRISGHHFCRVCGRDVSNDPIQEDCASCAEYRDRGHRFCAVCGKPIVVTGYPIPEQQPSLTPSFVLMSLSVVAGLMILLFELVTAFVKLPDVIGGLEGMEYWMFILTPNVHDLFLLNDMGMRIVYVVEALIVLASVSYLVYSAIKKAKTSDNRYNALKETALYEVICLNGLLFVFQLVYIFIFVDIGQSTPDLSNLAYTMFALMNASVYEEFLCRICLIGLPVMIVYLVSRKAELPFYRYLLGGFEFKPWMWALVLLSSIMFAWGHYDGWGLWKMVPTLLFGLITAYIFIKYGVYATISIHFLTDFLVSETWLLGTDLPTMLSMLMLLGSAVALGCIPHYYRKLRGIYRDLSAKKGGEAVE